VTAPNPNQLIVEGNDDKFAVIELMRAHIGWPEGKEDPPVWLVAGGGVEKILERDYLAVKLKTSGLKALGVALDADTNPQGRYESVRSLCAGMFPGLPNEMPAGGLVTEAGQVRFGLWIMPDNASEGSLETFLRLMIPEAAAPLWTHATESVARARTMGAACRDCHVEKANLYTWLAWQDPPGQSGGTALTRKILDPHSESSGPFVKWFRDLYRI
jgi:hypothetical protein